MTAKHIHFPRTTAAQRRLLFETAGYTGLAEFRNPAPKAPHRIAPEVEAQVKALRTQQPSWGKQRLADALAKGNNWVPLVSPNTVRRRILQDAELWPTPAEPAKKGGLRP